VQDEAGEGEKAARKHENVSFSLTFYGTSVNNLAPTVCHLGTAIKHPVPDRVKPSFVIFDIRALWNSGLNIRVPGCQKLQMTAYSGLARDALLTCAIIKIGIAKFIRTY